MNKTENEQPGVASQTLVTEADLEKSRQFETFKSRIVANIGQVHWPAKVQQYIIERSDLIPHALKHGFQTTVVENPEEACRHLENIIWHFNEDDLFRYSDRKTPMFKWTFAKAKCLLIWVLRQSKGLVEEVVLHSPPDPADDGFDSPIAQVSGWILDALGRSDSKYNFCFVALGLGMLLNFNPGSSQSSIGPGTVWHFYLTFRDHNAQKARRLFWRDAMIGVQEMMSSEFKPKP
ncbi:MAG: hypothetical protein WCT19_01455 [Candidatus Paceibacterota bacterium]